MTTHTLPRNGFTTRYLDTLKSEPQRFEIADPGTKGLRLRVSPGGTKSFIWYYRDGTKIRRLTLGQYGDGDNKLTVVKARQKLITTKARLNEGIKPHAESANAPKTVVDRGATVHANKVLGTLKQVFNFAQARGFVDLSPAHPLKSQDLGVVSNIRERALDTDDEGEAQADLVEIRTLWRALNQAPRLSPQNRLGTKILLLTGVRSGELRLARWEHIDFENTTWKIPASNTKNAKAWTVPLSPQVLNLFEKLHKSAEGSPWVLPSFTGEGPITEKAPARSVKRLFCLKDAGGVQR